ncbi:MAG: hypothetical protein O2888_04005 [Chloroflexi bacterium]|nr:hypothetical protein [Chloroflexota bacterium]
MDRFRMRLAIRRDEIAGFGPGAAFAGARALVSGGAIVVVLAAWLWAASRTGADITPTNGLMTAIASWAVLWFVLSAGVLVALWLGYRAWGAAYPVQQRRDEARERRAAVAAAAAIVDEYRSVRSPRDE